MLYYLPNHPDVDTKILVNDNDPQTNNLAPGHFGVFFPQFKGYIPARLPDDLELPDTGMDISAILTPVSVILTPMWKEGYATRPPDKITFFCAENLL